MNLLAALCVGAFAALAVGLARGVLPTGLVRRRVRPAEPGPAAAASGVAPMRFVVVSVGSGLVMFVLLAALTGAPAVAVVPAVSVALAQAAGRVPEAQ